eukprot:scaffold71225_cov21-Tisochrysis_lutea.AAC.2
MASGPPTHSLAPTQQHEHCASLQGSHGAGGPAAGPGPPARPAALPAPQTRPAAAGAQPAHATAPLRWLGTPC